jgi:opacity protein-like surface antigen
MYKISKLAAGSVIAATAAIGGAGVALADGYEPKGRVVYERPSDWSGVYFGVGSGYQWSSIDVTGPAIGISSDHDNAFVSAHLGIQHQFGNAVVGIEGGWMSSLRDKGGSSEFCDSVVPVLTAPILAPGNFCSAQLNDILTIGGRLGWAAGHWMPYVAGGYASGGYDFNVRTPGLVEQAHTRLGGWYVGGGFEWAISPGWTTGLEYRHYEFDTDSTTAFGPTTGPLETVRFDATTDTLTARVSWRWGRPEPAPLK